MKGGAPTFNLQPSTFNKLSRRKSIRLLKHAPCFPILKTNVRKIFPTILSSRSGKILPEAKHIVICRTHNSTPAQKQMKFGFRSPNLNKRIAARTSVKRVLRHNLGLKAPKGMGWITNPKRAAYNRVYNKTSRGCSVVWLVGVGVVYALLKLGL